MNTVAFDFEMPSHMAKSHTKDESQLLLLNGSLYSVLFVHDALTAMARLSSLQQLREPEISL